VTRAVKMPTAGQHLPKDGQFVKIRGSGARCDAVESALNRGPRNQRTRTKFTGIGKHACLPSTEPITMPRKKAERLIYLCSLAFSLRIHSRT
jgi:hypothetical protein